MRWRIAVAMALSASGCAVLGLGPRPHGEGALERLPVLLVLEGDQLSPVDAARVGRALARQIHRPVRITHETGIDLDALGARLRARYGRVPSAHDRCGLGAIAAQTLAHDAHAHYRLVLHERDGRLDGELVATTFAREPRRRRLAIRSEGPSPRIDELVAAGIRSLDAPAYPLWDGLARRLLARGCPLGALAVYDARLRDRPGSRDVLRAALADAAPPPAAVAATEPPADAPAPEPTERVSCKTLCELHMVELCNNDRELWSRHRASWEATPCGRMRMEPFLRECYQRQWITGTFHDACIVPCERDGGGRARLLHLLQGEGCARMPPS
jgi:hypothetical protein